MSKHMNVHAYRDQPRDVPEGNELLYTNMVFEILFLFFHFLVDKVFDIVCIQNAVIYILRVLNCVLVKFLQNFFVKPRFKI